MRSRLAKAAMTTPLIPAGGRATACRWRRGHNRFARKSSCPLSRNSSYPYTCEKTIPRTVSEKRKTLVWHCRLGRAGPLSKPFVCENAGGSCLRGDPPCPPGSSATRSASGSTASPPRSYPATSRPTLPRPARTAGRSPERPRPPTVGGKALQSSIATQMLPAERMQRSTLSRY